MVRCATAIFKIQKLDCVVVNDTVHTAICSACDAYLCVMSHMNGFHTYSVQL